MNRVIVEPSVRIPSMRNRIKSEFRRLFFLCALASIAAPAQSALIDFESLADLEVVTNQFAALGAEFSNAIVLEAFSTLNEIDFPPPSGIHVISGLAAGPITIHFLTPVDFFSVRVTTADTASITFLDATSSIIGSASVPPNTGSNTLVDFMVAPISMVTVAGGTGSAFALTLDDVTFDRATVPEPTTLTLIGSGLLGMIGNRRRR